MPSIQSCLKSEYGSYSHRVCAFDSKRPVSSLLAAFWTTGARWLGAYKLFNMTIIRVVLILMVLSSKPLLLFWFTFSLSVIDSPVTSASSTIPQFSAAPGNAGITFKELSVCIALTTRIASNTTTRRQKLSDLPRSGW
ncbi:hypothetical protein BDN72DRAFT_855709 [Pluteus cervinus]|uniref:Uncharacterized protein n=1 Tax=Pluteus cervinus TaxID=181527 RepID=A0ACD3B533_9AGAR|nr:hypothetical protein BDN72DRAFT_855709 [Pluteus cervinus]